MSEVPALAPATASTTAELVDQRDYNTRVWSVREEAVLRRDDGTEETEMVERRVVEVGSGICYKDAQGNFQPSNPHWETTPRGFVLHECAYGLSAGKTLAAPIVYTTRGGQFRFRPAFLKASSGYTAKVVASVDTSVTGVVDAEHPGRLVFPGAFGDLGDVEILAKKGSLHQNVILNGKPTTRLDCQGEDARLSVYTEVGLDEFLAEQGTEVRFGSSVIRGVGSNLDVAPSKGSPIGFYKTEPDGGGSLKDVLCHFFAESPVYSAADGEAAAVVGEKAERSLVRDPATNATYLVESIPLAFLDGADYPLIWDPQSVSGSYTPQGPWIPAVTYRVTADLYVSSGTLQILPGTVVKLDPNVTIYASGGAIDAKGEPYNYIVFTKTRDNNCGEAITGPADSPYMCAIYLMSGSPATSVVQYCKMGYGYFGVICLRSLGVDNPIAHNIIRGQNVLLMGIKVGSGANTSCHNNLITDSTWLGIQYYSSGTSETYITNNTIDRANVGVQLNYSTFGRVTDNLLTNAVYCGIDVTTSSVSVLDHNGFWMVGTPVAGGNMGPHSVDLPDAKNPYDDPCSVGEFYLDNIAGEGAELRDRLGGRSAEDARLNGAEFTVNTPFVAETSVTSNRYWFKHEPDTGIVDIGYHHNRVDRVLDGADTVVTNCGLIPVPGLVVVINGQGKTLRVGTEGKIICTGDPYASSPNLFASKRSVSMALEASLKLYPSDAQNELQVGLTLSADSIFDSRIRNAVFRGLYKGIKAERGCVFPIKNCRFDQNITGLESSGGAVPAFNNVFAWNKKGISGSLPYGQKVEFRNNTFDGNWVKGLELATVTGSATTVEDNLFTSNADAIRITGPPEQIVMGHNGFYANVEPQNDGDVVLGSSPYHVEGTLAKRWFISPGCALIDAGSTTTLAAKLLPYTTAYDESYDVGLIDIGYHAFTSTGPSTPDPDSPTLTITEVRDEFGYEPPDWPLQGMIDVTVETVDAESYSTEIVHLYVDGEFVTTAQPLTGAEHGANTCVFPSYREVNTYHPDYLSDWGHTLQAVAESTKPAVGRSDPVTVDTLFWADCVSLSGRELELDGSHTLECSGLLCLPCQAGVGVSALHAGWGTIWDGFPYTPAHPEWVNPTDPRGWAEVPVRQLGPRPEAYLFHETWDGRDGENNLVPDSVYTFQLFIDILGDAPVFWEQVSAFSTPITEAEVAIFLPLNTLWDGFSAQAVVNACWQLGLSYRILVDQTANWDNLKTFLTCERPSGRYPSVLYVSGHGDWQETYEGQQYQVTCFVLSDGDVYATTSPGVDFGGDLPWSFVGEDNCTKRHFISDPQWNMGLKDPRFYGVKELSETDWVKFVWVNACYSQLDSGNWGGGMSDMSIALGMACNDEHDQSFIGFRGLTPNSFYDQWASSVYTWLFWYYLSVASGMEPDYPVKVAKDNASLRITEWLTDEYMRWFALVVAYVGEINTISDPALEARLKDHIGEQ